MGSHSTRHMANLCVDRMKKMGWQPDLVLNVGVGTCHPELFVWRKRLPGTMVLGVDIRLGLGLWDALSVNVLAGAESGRGSYCWTHKSLKCDCEKRISVKIRTIDEIMQRQRVKPKSIFMWIDVEGSELDVLKGATKTLSKTPLICLENKRNRGEIAKLLGELGYSRVDEEATKSLEDALYHRALN